MFSVRARAGWESLRIAWRKSRRQCKLLLEWTDASMVSKNAPGKISNAGAVRSRSSTKWWTVPKINPHAAIRHLVHMAAVRMAW